MSLKFHVPIGPDDPSDYADFRQYLEPDTRGFSSGHPLLVRKFVGPLDPLIPDAFEDLVDLIPDGYMTLKAPFKGTLSRDSEDPEYVIIRLDDVHYHEQIAASRIPVASKVTHVYLGPVSLPASIETDLSAQPVGFTKVEAGQVLGELTSRYFHLGFYINTSFDRCWVSAASVIHHLVDQNHPLIDNVASPGTIGLTVDADKLGNRLAVASPAENYYLAVVEKEDHDFRLFSRGPSSLSDQVLTLFSGDRLTFYKLNPDGDVISPAAGEALELDLEREPAGLEDSLGVLSEYKIVNFDEPVRLRDLYGDSLLEVTPYLGGLPSPFYMYTLKVWLDSAYSSLWARFDLMQDDIEMLREEYLDKDLPPPPRHWFSTPQRKSLRFDMRNLFLQHDYSSVKKSDDFWADETYVKDLTITENDVRQAAEYVQARYDHYVLDPSASEFSQEQRQRISTRLLVTRGYVNPKRNEADNYPRLHPQQYGRSIEFKPFLTKGSYRKRLIRALANACTDFLTELRAVNDPSQVFSYRFLSFAKFSKQLWSIRLESDNTAIADKPVNFDDTGGIALQSSAATVGGVAIDSTVDAVDNAHRISISWQIPDTLTRIALPPVPAAPVIDVIDDAEINKTNLILLATEFSNLSQEHQLALDDKAETLRAWFAKEHPEDDTLVRETMSLFDVYNELRLFDRSPFRIRNMAVVSHAGPNHLLVRSFVVPDYYTAPIANGLADDAPFMTHYMEKRDQLMELYPPGVKFYPEMRVNGSPGIRPQRWSIDSLVKLSNATKQRLREVFRTAESIVLTGCNADYENFEDSSTFSGVLSRLTNTDVYGARMSTVSMALRNDGKWQWHGLPGTGTVGDHRGTPFVPGSDPGDLRDPLTVISVYKDERTEFTEDPRNHYPPEKQFDVMHHYTHYLAHRFAPQKRRS